MSVDWTAVLGVATALYTVAFIASLSFLLLQLRRQAEERFVTSTQAGFRIWMSDEFQRAQQWVLYELKEDKWRDFVAHHRNDYGERAFTQVGSFYNRIGYLVVYHLLGRHEEILLDTVAGSAIAVWRKLEPLVEEARLQENVTLFMDFERMLPQCYECYSPNQPVPMEIREAAAEAERIAAASRLAEER